MNDHLCTETDQQADTVAEWNERHSVGTPVRYWTGWREGEGRKSVTRTRAYLLAGHTAVVMVKDHGACIALTHVAPEAPDGGGDA